MWLALRLCRGASWSPHREWDNGKGAKMSYQRTHRYCNGTGEVPRASGMPGFCFACNGTGKITVYTAAEKAARKAEKDRWSNTRSLIEARARKIQAPEGVSQLTFRLDAVSGYDRLGEREPGRMIKLYESVAAGRIDDVVRALYAYWNEGTCTKCGKRDLPRGMVCTREPATKGMCIRCCPHNHG